MSLNKKFMCTFFIFFTLLIGLFLVFFFKFYNKNTLDEEQNFLTMSSQLIDVAYDNNYLVSQAKKAIAEKRIVPEPRLVSLVQDDNYTQNKKIIESLNNIYSKKYDRLQYLLQFMLAGLIWISISVVFLWIMLRQMVLKSVNRLIFVSEEVGKGNFSQRVYLKHQWFKDEFFILSSTFNQMLRNIEDNIIKISNNQYFLQSLIDAIPDGIRVMDADGRIILANRAYQKLFDVKKCVGEYCFKHSMNIDHFCPESKMLCPLRQFQKKGVDSLSTVQTFVKNPNRPISINAAKMIINNKHEYVIEAIRDLSNDIKFSHQQKISSLAFLATSVAHEMKNNLGSLRLIMEQLLENKHFANKQEEMYFNLAYQQIVECIKIPENLLSLARNSSETSQIIDIKEIVGSVYSLLDYDAKRKGIELRYNIDDKALVEGNEPDFKMIFLNLCQNAIKAMPNGGELLIEAKKKNKKVEIIVKDTGNGIEKQKLRRIFEPFFSSNNFDGKGFGTGLGLSIVKSLVENFNGNIKVKSKIGQGSIFTMIFPLKVNK